MKINIGYNDLWGQRGYQLCIIDSGADHADLTEDYAAVPAEMKSVARCFRSDMLSVTLSRKTAVCAYG